MNPIHWVGPPTYRKEKIGIMRDRLTSLSTVRGANMFLFSQ